ncbi:hypothetical protein B0H13DRAFT_2364041 [Mycena leptocephala]|nr:hypothetical protein B0H13DRAFT_2364041 [Mycena leptocephala]
MSTSAHARQRGPWRAQLHAKSRGAAAAAALLRAAFFNSHVNSTSSTLHPNLPTQNLTSSSHTAVSYAHHALVISTRRRGWDFDTGRAISGRGNARLVEFVQQLVVAMLDYEFSPAEREDCLHSNRERPVVTAQKMAAT